MHRKPLRTYGKKPVTNQPGSSSHSLIKFLHRIYHLSDDSDEDLLEKNNRDVSIKNDTLESTFDRISKDVKLPPMPPDNSKNNSELYISSSSSSSSDENLMQNIRKSPKVPTKKINKRKKKTDDDKKKNNIRLKRVPTFNRKRQNNLQDINKDEMENVELSLPPKRKARRAMKAHKIPEINSISDESDINKCSNELKSSSDKLPRIKITNNNSDDDQNLCSPVVINKQNDNFSSIKDCRIVLSRLDVNSTGKNNLFPINDSKILISSTPFFHRTTSKIIPTFSPIESQTNCTNENNELSEIYKINDKDETKEIKLQDSLIIKSQINPSISIENTQIYSPNNVDSLEDNKIKYSSDINEKSTELLFESDDNVEKLIENNNTKSPDESINSFKSSIEGVKSCLIFEETESKISNINNDSASIWGSYENPVNEIESFDKTSEDDEKNIELIQKNNLNYNENTESSSEDSYHLVVSNSPVKNTNSETNSSLDIAEDKIINCENETKIDKQINITNPSEPFVLLTRLDDPVKITHRRDKYANWNDQLCTIIESFEQRSSISLPECKLSLDKIDLNKNKNSPGEIEKINKIPRHLSRRTRFSNYNNDQQIIHNKSLDSEENKIVFLKPGKSWARSLSILNHINNNDDFETLSLGKGKKWRQSVKSILDMQSQGGLQSCIKFNECDNDKSPVSNGIYKNPVTFVSSSTVTGNFESTSPGRFIRRVSIRVVPDVKYSTIEDKDVKDTSFLEVYGIPTSKNRQTFGKRLKSIEQRDTLGYNLRHTNANIADNSIESVDTARNVVLQRCNQTDVVPFDEFYPKSFLEKCRKIGEGVYGEVFLFENKREKSVIKIIPIEGDKLVNGETQKKYSEILSEIIIAKTSGFIEVKNIRCLFGKYPQKLIEHWRTFDEEKKSDNDCPSMFDDNQLYIALELAHGGQDLEAFVFQNASEAYISFIQAALTLAVAEKSLDFEHRDLHWGNILISRTDETDITYKLDTEEIIFPCKGLKVAIIDFTLSRTSYQGCCIFNDLALDEALFTAVGDYQFEIYKLMRAKVGNNWQLFEPYTNILWLHYTLDKMINGVRYKKKTTKIHKNAILKLQELKDTLLDYDSAYDFITNCSKTLGLQHKNLS
ncbi:hypothetical protein PV325_001915 [Microctonus aethiopoides]|nr:hypothetical protein PV325_001915 [Microctonus aethiopoides]